MRPLPFVWPYWLAFWAVFVWAFSPEYRIIREARRPAAGADSPDAGSYRVIVFGQSIATMVAFPLAWLPALRVPSAADLGVFVLGLCALVAGSLLRRHCWRRLGESFTGDVRAHPDQAIVRTGVYALVRHPSYTAGLVMHLGIGLALGSWGSAALLVLASFAVYAYRIAVEERALLAVVGEPYRDYMRKTPKRLVPLVF